MELQTGYKALNDTVPELPYVFQVEKTFDVQASFSWIDRTFHWVLLIVVAYLVLIYSGQHYMRARARYELTKPLFLWNLALALFSLIAVSRCLFELHFVLTRFGFKHSVCHEPLKEHYNTLGLWSVVYSVSKVVELGDTAFIILRKQPLIFLHWYHHITVLLGVWYTAGEANAVVRWMVTLNLLVHVFMYTHFALRTVRVTIPRLITMLLTALQTTQMVVVLIVNGAAYYFLKQGQYCHVTLSSIKLYFCVAFTYFVLFAHYFYGAYITETPMLKSLKLKRKKTE